MSLFDAAPKIPDALINYLIKEMNDHIILFFAGCFEVYGNYAPCFSGAVPHPVHLREGMQIRNLIRQSGLCPEWDDHMLDNMWTYVIHEVVEEYKHRVR